MQNVPVLESMPLWAIYVVTAALFLATIEGAYQASKAMQRRSPDDSQAGVGTMVGAMLALLAFLLAFVASTALSIAASRRNLVVAEANAIGTTYLRAGYLPEAEAETARSLLGEYVDMRLLALDRGQRAQAGARSEEIQRELWLQAEGLARQYATPTMSLYLSSLNQVIDLHTERINSELVVRVPHTILLGLYLVGLLTMGMVGLQAGYTERHNVVAILALVLILSTVYLLIFDLDRGQSGLIQTPQRAMVDLQTLVRAGWP